VILLDTNVLSELARPAPHPTVLAWARGVRPSELATTAVTEAELRYGLALLPAGQRRDALATAMEALLARLLAGRVLPFDRAAALHYADYAAARRAVGRPVATADAMIAAIARARGITTLVTRNTADFDGCGMTLLDPWQERP
jgi:predicted nucleic acid-binding protein